MEIKRVGCFALLAMILAAGISGEAIAEAKGRLHRARNSLLDVRSTLPAHGGPHEQARLGQARYHGGPKSPMWRGAAEN
jgi:hypothetical protein